MKTFISFFIFLISFFAPAQAINFATPAQIGSYSNPIEPIKPKAKTYKFWKKPIQNKIQEDDAGIVIFSIFFTLCLIAGFIIFSIGFLQSAILLFWLGLGLEFLCVGWLLGLLIYAVILDNWDALLPYIISFFGIPIVLTLKGLLLIGLGFAAISISTWVIGLSMFVLGVLLLSLLWYALEKL